MGRDTAAAQVEDASPGGDEVVVERMVLEGAGLGLRSCLPTVVVYRKAACCGYQHPSQPLPRAFVMYALRDPSPRPMYTLLVVRISLDRVVEVCDSFHTLVALRHISEALGHVTLIEGVGRGRMGALGSALGKEGGGGGRYFMA